MKIVELANVGDASEWLCLGDVLCVLMDHEPEGEQQAEVYERCRHISIRAKVLSERDKRRMAAEAAGAEAGSVEQLDVDRATMVAGLDAIQGTNLVDVGDKLFDALEASDYSWLVAATIRHFNSLLQEKRAGYFTRARAGLSSSAKDAPPSDAKP